MREKTASEKERKRIFPKLEKKNRKQVFIQPKDDAMQELDQHT